MKIFLTAHEKCVKKRFEKLFYLLLFKNVFSPTHIGTLEIDENTSTCILISTRYM